MAPPRRATTTPPRRAASRAKGCLRLASPPPLVRPPRAPDPPPTHLNAQRPNGERRAKTPRPRCWMHTEVRRDGAAAPPTLAGQWRVHAREALAPPRRLCAARARSSRVHTLRCATKEQAGWRRRAACPPVRRLSMSPTAALPADGRVCADLPAHRLCQATFCERAERREAELRC